MALSRILLVGMAAIASAVTPESSTPTDDSNYMVMQGDWTYLNSRPASHGFISGRVQLVRSALTATSTFSFSIHFSDSNAAPAAGTTLTAKIGRHICTVVDTAAASTPYQDPYNCPGFSLSTNANTCDAEAVAQNPNLEASVACNVATSGGSAVCTGSLAWPVYIPEYYEDQLLEDMSFVISSDEGEFACANLDAARDLVATESVASSDTNNNVPSLTSGGLEKDELGYTHMSMSLDSLTPSSSYTAFVSTSPCSTVDASFAGHSVTDSLSVVFSADGAGEATVSAFADSIVSAGSLSMVLAESASVIGCFDLEMPYAPGGRSGQIGGNQDSCAVWQPFYSNDEADAVGMGMGKGKGGKHDAPAFDDFASMVIGAESRCCLSASFDASDGKGKRGHASSLTLKQKAAAQLESNSGIYAGATGALILAVAVTMHVRRRSQAVAVEDGAADENTPILQASSESTKAAC